MELIIVPSQWEEWRDDWVGSFIVSFDEMAANVCLDSIVGGTVTRVEIFWGEPERDPERNMHIE